MIFAVKSYSNHKKYYILNLYITTYLPDTIKSTYLCGV